MVVFMDYRKIVLLYCQQKKKRQKSEGKGLWELLYRYLFFDWPAPRIHGDTVIPNHFLHRDKPEKSLP